MFISDLLEKFQRPTLTSVLVEGLHNDSQMDIARPLLKRHQRGDRSSGARLGWLCLVAATISRLKPAAHEAEHSTVRTDRVKRGPHAPPSAEFRVPDTEPGVYTSNSRGNRCDRRPDSQAAGLVKGGEGGDDSPGRKYSPSRTAGTGRQIAAEAGGS